MTTTSLIQDTLLAIVVILVFGFLWRTLRVFVYIGFGILLVINLPYLMHGQIPPWIIPFVTAGTTWLSRVVGNGIGSWHGSLRLP